MEVNLTKTENNDYAIESISLYNHEINEHFIRQLIKHFERVIKQKNKEIEKIEKNPKNEGQAYFLSQVSELKSEIYYFSNQINDLKTYPLLKP